MKTYFLHLLLVCVMLHIDMSAKEYCIVAFMLHDNGLNQENTTDSALKVRINRTGKSGLDSTVHYTAKDSVVFRLSKKKVRLKIITN